MKPQSREEWRVMLQLLRMLRTFSPHNRWQLYQHGLMLEDWAKKIKKRGRDA